MVFGTVDVVLVTEDAVGCKLVLVITRSGRRESDIPNTHAGSRNSRQPDSTGETLVTLRIIVLEADLEFDGLEEISLLLI